MFVGTVATIVFTVAEQPLGDTSVIRVSWTTLPSGGAVLLSAHVRRLVAVVTAIIVGIAHPQYRNALAVLTTELSVLIARTIICER